MNAQYDPLIEEFYKSLTPAEKEAHSIAARMLGSSYIVNKTHAYTKWHAKRVAKAASASASASASA